MTLDDYDNMWIEQVGKCVICGDPLPYGYSAHIDHDHVSGKVRSLLCFACNRGIGDFRENEDIMKKSIAYIRGEM